MRTLIKSWISKKHYTRVLNFSLSVFSAIICIIANICHYNGLFRGNNFTWVFYITSIVFLLAAFFPTSKFKSLFNIVNIKTCFVRNKLKMLFYSSATIMFAITYFQNMKSSPAFYSGLYDDAAWQLYMIKDHVFGGKPFEAVVYVPLGGKMETLFAYVVGGFLQVFGKNLLVFNIALVLLGFITFIFTVLLIQKMFKNYSITGLSAVIMCFFPVLYGNIFCGHRYAIVPPLIMSSLYFLYTGFKRKSYLRVSIGSILAGLSFASASLGKPFLPGLLIALVFMILFNIKNRSILNKTNFHLFSICIYSALISMIPLIMYCIYDPTFLISVESQYAKETLFSGNLNLYAEYWNRMLNCLFSATNWARRFCGNFVLIPIPYYLLIIPGIIVSLVKKRFFLLIIAFLYFASAYTSANHWDVYDYRILPAIPILVVMAADFINSLISLISSKFEKGIIIKVAAYLVVVGIAFAGIIPSAKYINTVSKDTFSLVFLKQFDVTDIRFLKDIIEGSPNPSGELKWDELDNRNISKANYDVLCAQKLAYAAAYTFLYNYNADNQVLSFCPLPMKAISDSNVVLGFNKSAIQNYHKTNKDLKLIWEVDPLTQPIIDAFKVFRVFGSQETLSYKYKGETRYFYVLTIKNSYIDEFKQKARRVIL